ncbi:MAG: restriction endonuclease subunit S [Clostridia bacterium]|nr:restriction endonuclease subunit S [Clostridia bacterium]
MALTKYKLGELIKQRREKYDGLEELPIKGVAREGFISPKQDGADLSIYNVYYLNDFVFNPARMELNSIALNTFWDKAICSSLYEIFYITRTDLLLPEYLNLYIKRDEFARKCWFEAVGSARNYFRVADLSEFDIELPDLPTQQKYVDIYKAMVANQQSYERGLKDLKLVCDAYIENISADEYKSIGLFIKRNQNKNQEKVFNKTQVKGFNNEGEFIKPMRLFSGDISTFKVIKKNDFVYNSRINSTIKKLSVALNEGDDLIVSPAYESFYICDTDKLDPYYLYMLLQREQFAKKVLFHSFGSSTLVFGFDNLGEVEIPIPDIQIQRAIANIYRTYKERKAINEKLKAQIKDICPILIQGSLEEGK